MAGLFKSLLNPMQSMKSILDSSSGGVGHEYYQFKSDPEKIIRASEYNTGKDGVRNAISVNPNLAAIQQADEQRFELQKKTGKRGSSILGGGLY